MMTEHCFPGMYARVAIAVSGAPSVPLVPDHGLNGDEIVATNLGQTPQEGERVHTVAVPQR